MFALRIFVHAADAADARAAAAVDVRAEDAHGANACVEDADVRAEDVSVANAFAGDDNAVDADVDAADVYAANARVADVCYGWIGE